MRFRVASSASVWIELPGSGFSDPIGVTTVACWRVSCAAKTAAGYALIVGLILTKVIATVLLEVSTRG